MDYADFADLSHVPETDDESSRPLVRISGPMRGHLSPYIGKLTNLEHLRLRTVGQDDVQIGIGQLRGKTGDTRRWLHSLRV